MTHQPFALSFFANVDLPEPGRPTRRRTRAGPLEAPTPQSPRGLGDFPCSRHLPLSEGSGWLPSGYVDRSPPPRSEPRFFFTVTHSPAIARRRFSHTTPHPFLDRLDRSSFRVLLMISANPKVCFFFVCLLIDETVAPHRSSCSAVGDFSRKDGWRWLIGRCFFSYVLSQVHSSHTHLYKSFPDYFTPSSPRRVTSHTRTTCSKVKKARKAREAREAKREVTLQAEIHYKPLDPLQRSVSPAQQVQWRAVRLWWKKPAQCRYPSPPHPDALGSRTAASRRLPRGPPPLAPSAS